MRMVKTAGMAMLGGLLLLVLAWPQDSRNQPAGGGAQKTDNFVLILDQSGEMNVPYGPKNESKNYIAKKIAEGFVVNVPDNIPVKGALYYYGVAAKDASNTVVRAMKMQGFNRGMFKDAIAQKLDKNLGASSLSWALKMVKDDLDGVPGRTAVIIISGGNKTDLGKPSHELADLKQTYKEKVCVYTVYIGKSDDNQRFLKGLVDDGKCGFAMNSDDLQSDKNLRQWTRRVFFKD